jgi:hypothetical protein
MKNIGSGVKGPVARKLAFEATCIGCGCTDMSACLPLVGDPCHWLRVDRELKIGVCSECEHKIGEFEKRVNAAKLDNAGTA